MVIHCMMLTNSLLVLSHAKFDMKRLISFELTNNAGNH